MHPWLSRLLDAYRPAAQYRALIEGWPPPFDVRPPNRPRGRRARLPIRFRFSPAFHQEVRP